MWTLGWGVVVMERDGRMEKLRFTLQRDEVAAKRFNRPLDERERIGLASRRAASFLGHQRQRRAASQSRVVETFWVVPRAHIRSRCLNSADAETTRCVGLECMRQRNDTLCCLAGQHDQIRQRCRVAPCHSAENAGYANGRCSCHGNVPVFGKRKKRKKKRKEMAAAAVRSLIASGRLFRSQISLGRRSRRRMAIVPTSSERHSATSVSTRHSVA